MYLLRCFLFLFLSLCLLGLIGAPVHACGQPVVAAAAAPVVAQAAVVQPTFALATPVVPTFAVASPVVVQQPFVAAAVATPVVTTPFVAAAVVQPVVVRQRALFQRTVIRNGFNRTVIRQRIR